MGVYVKRGRVGHPGVCLSLFILWLMNVGQCTDVQLVTLLDSPEELSRLAPLIEYAEAGMNEHLDSRGSSVKVTIEPQLIDDTPFQSVCTSVVDAKDDGIVGFV